MYNDQKISVVLATYNGEKFLQKQLDSLRNQTLIPDEIVICDDQSTDQTLNIANAFANDVSGLIDVKVYKNPQNLRFALNFVTGVNNSSGDIVFLCDQDDEWDREKIQIMTEVMTNSKNVLSLCCSYDLIDEQGKVLENKLAHKQGRDGQILNVSWDSFIKAPRFAGMSMAIRRELHEYIMHHSLDGIPAHDWLYNEEAAKRGGLYKLNNILIHYRQHSDNTVGIVENGTVEELFKNRTHVIDFYKRTHEFLKKKYHADVCLSRRMVHFIEIDNQRMIYIKNRKLIRSCLLFCINMKSISLRTYLGDMLTILKMKKK